MFSVPKNTEIIAFNTSSFFFFIFLSLFHKKTTEMITQLVSLSSQYSFGPFMIERD
jgi:hypothetical protein